MGGVIGVMIIVWLFIVIERWLRKVVLVVIEFFFVLVVILFFGVVVLIFVIMLLLFLLMKGFIWLFVDFVFVKGGIIGGFIFVIFFLFMVMLGIY